VRETLTTTLILLTSFEFILATQLIAGSALRPRQRLRQASPGGLRRWVLLSTDTDLRVELILALYLSLCVIGARLARPRPPGDLVFVLLIVSVVAGGFFRQCLSKWRLHRLVRPEFLGTSSLPHFRGVSEVSAMVLTSVVIGFLILLDDFYALVVFFGFITHEMASEWKKRSHLVKRKLHLFDVEILSKAPEAKRIISRSVSPFGSLWPRRSTRLGGEAPERLIVRGFEALLHDDFHTLRALVENHEDRIRSSSDGAYFFGRAAYVVGEIRVAQRLLDAGFRLHGDDRCVPFLALVEAEMDQRRPPALLRAEKMLTAALPSASSDRVRMELFGIRALVLALNSSGPPSIANRRLNKAMASVLEAMRLNQQLRNKMTFSSESRLYFDAFSQMYADICGYVLYRRGNYELAYRVLEDAVLKDPTYPWPYFHIGLIYEAVGQKSLAEILYHRIGESERSETVLKRLCEQRCDRSCTASRETRIDAGARNRAQVEEERHDEENRYEPSEGGTPAGS
jgi:tetratricopeptide (TPR) repeat protein